MQSVLNSPLGAGSGMYGLLAFVALLAPLAPQFWKEHLGGLMPLMFMLFVVIMAYSGITTPP